MFVLTKAVEREINPYSTQYLSAPFVGPGNWHVQTFEKTYSGRIPLTQATLLSDNTVYARLTLDLGPKPIAELAHRMGIQSNLKPVPSIVLGVNAVSPLDLATAYATLADGGVAARPDHPARRSSSPTATARTPPTRRGSRSSIPRSRASSRRCSRRTSSRGPGRRRRFPGRPAAGKTGTTDSFADAWFAGWVPQLTTVTWVGYPTGERPMKGVHGIAGVTGGTLPAEIWHTYMTGALQGQPVEQFATPGAPPFKPWCGRYQFARTWRDARKQGTAATTSSTRRRHKHKKKNKTTTKQKTTTAHTTTARTSRPRPRRARCRRRPNRRRRPRVHHRRRPPPIRRRPRRRPGPDARRGSPPAAAEAAGSSAAHRRLRRRCLQPQDGLPHRGARLRATPPSSSRASCPTTRPRRRATR